ncbi:MAG: D-aminoacyl-tRNA deacylase [Halolamina sp.]
MIAIVVSRADRASEHIGDRLLDLVDWTERTDDGRADGDGGGSYWTTDGFKLRTFNDLHLEVDDAAGAFGDHPDLLLFVSRHSGDTGPLLTGHFTGNFGAAEYGGEDRDLARAAPNALSVLYAAFERYAPAAYDVAVEGTHHGPTAVGCPSLFVELGSDDEQWDDPAGATAVARAVLALRGVAPDRERTVVGVGGGHYAPRFERVLAETPWAVGHVLSDWQLDALGHPEAHRDVVAQLFAESDAELALLDGDYPQLEAVVEDLGYRTVGETWLREVGAKPLDRVAALEDALCPVEEGLRFGEVDLDGEFVVVALPTALLDAARAVDADATRRAVFDAALAVETVESGNRVAGRAALLPGSYDGVVDDLVGILRAEYDEVVREDGVVRVTEAAFDPSAAAALGIPEGPEFGRLADGEAVEVDGETVPPEAVSTERTHEYDVAPGDHVGV